MAGCVMRRGAAGRHAVAQGRRTGIHSRHGRGGAGRCRRIYAEATEADNLEKLQAVFNTPLDDDLYLPIGRATCFAMHESSSGKLHEKLVIEPIPSPGLEAMSKGMATSYAFVYGSTLGEALAMDKSKLPDEFASAEFATNFRARCESAARTWDRNWPREALMDIVPSGELRSDFNFDTSGDNKRVMDVQHVVNDNDNIKQDMSIDVYGRGSQKKDEDEAADIAELYNV